MKFPSSRKLTAAVLMAALAATSVVPGVASASDNVATAATENTVPPEKPEGDLQPGNDENGQPPAKPGEGGADTMTYDYTGTLSGALTADGEEVTAAEDTLSTETVDQNVGLAQNGGALILSGMTLDKSGSDTNGDNCNFYGINSILLSVGEKSVIRVSDSALTADSTGSNAIFATDGGTVYANDNTIVTSASNSRGLDATYGGQIIANLMAISTAGDHCAALATDRGGGEISLTNSTLFTAGSGSPLLYSTGNVQVDNVTGTATGSQIAGMEGLNTILITNSNLTSEITKATASDPVANGVIIYQSTSGDAEAATGERAEFKVKDSTLTSAISEGSMFYLTNTSADIVLENTTLSFDSDAANLLTIAGNDANSWGTPGSNGADVTFTGRDQVLTGDISVDTISSLVLYLLDGTTYTGATSIVTNADASRTSDAPITVNIDDDSTWVVMGDSTVTNLNVASGGSVVDGSGKSVTIVANGETVVEGDSATTITVTGSYSTSVDASGAGSFDSDNVIDRSDFDLAYGTSTTFGSNAGEARNEDVTIQEATGGDDVTGDGSQPPALPGEGSLSYTDVTSAHWAYEDIVDISNAGLMTGTGANTFSPELSLNRAMLVAILYRLEGSPEVDSADFSDVADGDWYAEAVAWAEDNGIVSGYGDTTFRPMRAISREEFAAILYRYADYKGYDTSISDSADLSAFDDTDSIGAGFDTVVLWANDKGYIRGTTETTFSPDGVTTRAQTASILMRFLTAEDAVPQGQQGGQLDDNGEPAKPEGDLQPGNDENGQPPAKPDGEA